MTGTKMGSWLRGGIRGNWPAPDRVERRPWADYHTSPYWGNDNEPGKVLLIQWTNPFNEITFETVVTDDYWSTYQIPPRLQEEGDSDEE